MHKQTHMQHNRWQIVALAQALYYGVTGIWPLVHIRSFEQLTGPKVDRWLVKTVGGLVTVIGATLAAASLRRPAAPELTFLAAGSAAVLAAIDVIYVAGRRIAPIYLLDALAETLLIGGWAWAWRRR